MKKKYLLGVFSVIIWGCNPTVNVTPSPACQQNNTGTLNVTSTSTNPYTITVDGTSKGSVTGGGSQTYDIAVGSHSVTATQNSGYLVYPTVKTATVTISQCQTTGFTFP